MENEGGGDLSLGGEGGVRGLRNSASVYDMMIYLAMNEMPLQASCKSKEPLRNISKSSTERG